MDVYLMLSFSDFLAIFGKCVYASLAFNTAE